MKRVGWQEVTEEQKERARKLLEEARARREGRKGQPADQPTEQISDPDKWAPMPGYVDPDDPLSPVQRSVRGHDWTRAHGALLGLAVGDALGTTLEFARTEAPPFPTLADGPHRDVTGGGPFALAPGQVTDDTQMAVCLASSLAEAGRLDVDDVAHRYVAWQEHAFDVGGQTARALARISGGQPPLEAGRAVWEGSDRQAAGNGSLMRTAPIGVLLANEGRDRYLASMADSAITHFDPRCQLACAAFNAAVADALRPEDSPAARLVAAARRELDEAALVLAAAHGDLEPVILDARDALRRDLDLAGADDPELYGPEVHLHDHEGYVRVAFRLAFWELLHAPTFEAGVVDAANRGGDADTNAAIAGALLGAWHGRLAIPEPWIDRVLEALQDDGPPSPLRGTYHPRMFMQILGELYRA